MDTMNPHNLSVEELKREIHRLRSFIVQFSHEASEVVEGDKRTKEIADDVHAEMQRLRDLVMKDDLTGALNRRGLHERFSELFLEALYLKQNTQAKRQFAVRDFAVIFVDADNFKRVNDVYGHDAGDEALRGIADILKQSIRGIDGVARLGGEEFVVALVGANEDEAFRKAEEIRTGISEKVKVSDDGAFVVSVSIGVAALGASDADVFDELIGYADAAMYEAKTSRGKNNTVRYSELAHP